MAERVGGTLARKVANDISCGECHVLSNHLVRELAIKLDTNEAKTNICHAAKFFMVNEADVLCRALHSGYSAEFLYNKIQYIKQVCNETPNCT